MSSLRILVLEDDELDFELVASMIGDAHFEQVKKLVDALGLIADRAPDVLILDLNLEDSLGIETYRTVRASFGDLPILIASHMSDIQTAVTAVREGAQDFVFKEDLLHLKSLDTKVAFVIERAKTTRALREAEAIAKQQSEFKSVFLAQFSHEIRTPLNAVIGMADLLEGYIDHDEGLALLDSLKVGADRLFAIVDDILDISKIESGTLDISCEMINIREVIESMVKLFGSDAKSKGVFLGSIVYSNVPRDVETDPKRLKQVLANLLGNALKFTRNGCVTVIAKWLEDKNTLECSVADTGIGISKEDLPKLFQPFSMVGDAKARQKGTGLGLVICKKLAEALAGGIKVESQLGRGTTFTFWIGCQHSHTNMVDRFDFSKTRILVVGLEQSHAEFMSEILQERDITAEFAGFHVQVEQLVDACDLVIFDHKVSRDCLEKTSKRCPVIVLSDSYMGDFAKVRFPLIQSTLYAEIARGLGEKRRVAKKPVTAHEDEQLGILRVLVVDDDPMNLRVMTKMMEKFGISPLLAQNGQESVDLFAQGHPIDLVFMDCSMPVMDGMEATTKIREMGINATIIALTAHAFSSDRDNCLNAGMDGFLTKPIKVAEIEKTLRSVLRLGDVA